MLRIFDRCTPLQEHSVFANAPRVARSMALLAKKRQARKSQVGSMVMVEFFEKINNHNDHLRLRLLLGYEFWQTDGGNFIPYSQSRADFMKVVSWNSTPQGTLNIWVLLQGSSWTLWCFVALKIWVLSNNQPDLDPQHVQDMTRLGHLEAACDVAPMLEIGEFEKTWLTSILACIHRYELCIFDYLTQVP